MEKRIIIHIYGLCKKRRDYKPYKGIMRTSGKEL